jgi:DNA-binding protein H-NS
MEAMTLTISLGEEELHKSSHSSAQEGKCELKEAADRRAFMAETIEGLKKLKEASDICLTELIEKSKAEQAAVSKGAIP